MSEKYLNPNYLANVCSHLYESTGNYGYDNLATVLKAPEETFDVFFPESAQAQFETVSQVAPEA